MERISEIYETESVLEVNERLQKEWVLLLIRSSPIGPLYVLGRRNKTENIKSQTTDTNNKLKELLFGEADIPDTALDEVLNYVEYLKWKSRHHGK